MRPLPHVLKLGENTTIFFLTVRRLKLVKSGGIFIVRSDPITTQLLSVFYRMHISQGYLQTTFVLF